MVQVSVLITSYNQADLLPAAIVSVLAQRVNFDYEIIIVDDGSSDNSRNVIADYAAKFHIIRPFYEDHKGIMNTYILGFSKCRGKYVALCDGDDYWVDQSKLQKQLDYMEDNPLAGACFTRALIKNYDGKEEISTVPPFINFNTMLKGGHMFSPTMFIRLDFLKYFWRTLEGKRFFIWDYPIYLYLTYYFGVGYLNDITAVYRKHKESFSNTRLRKRRAKYVFGLLRIKKYFILKYGCKLNTFGYVMYRFARDIYSLIFGRWYK